MGIRPKILLVGFEQFGTARLPRELQAAGFLVGLACRPYAFLAKTKFFDERFLLSRKNYGLGLMAALRSIVSSWKPDWVVPMDDYAALFIAQVCRWNRTHNRDTVLADLLTRSLGNPNAVFLAVDKWRAWQSAAAAGIRVPAGQLVRSLDEASAFGAQHGYPFVLKRCFGHGGIDIQVCQDHSQTVAGWAGFREKKSLAGRFRAWRHIFSGRTMGADWLPANRGVMASKFISGQPAMVQAVAFEGRMLGALEAVAEKTFPHAVSPASVVRFIRHAEMRRAAEALLAHWKFSGFISFDFILDGQNRAWFLECNPRPIPISHLGSRVGEDLCRRFYAQLVAAPLPAENAFHELVVAHFPRELRRDPQSPWLQNAWHDVPVNDPELVIALQNESVRARQA